MSIKMSTFGLWKNKVGCFSFSFILFCFYFYNIYIYKYMKQRRVSLSPFGSSHAPVS